MATYSHIPGGCGARLTAPQGSLLLFPVCVHLCMYARACVIPGTSTIAFSFTSHAAYSCIIPCILNVPLFSSVQEASIRPITPNITIRMMTVGGC